MKPVSDFFSRVLPYLPGCSEPLVAEAIVDAAIMFCEDSHVIRPTLDIITTVEGVGTYDLLPPNQQLIGRVMRVWLGQQEIRVLPTKQSPLTASGSGMPSWVTTARDGQTMQLRMACPTDKAYELLVEVSTRPTRGASTLEDDLLNYWADAVCAGAFARLMGVPNQPFSNPGGAMAQAAWFAYLTRKAKAEGDKGRTLSSLTVRPRPLA